MKTGICGDRDEACMHRKGLGTGVGLSMERQNTSGTHPLPWTAVFRGGADAERQTVTSYSYE